MLLVSLAAAAFPKPPDYNILSRRISSRRSEEADVQCLLLDSMVPRQRVEMQFGPPITQILHDVRESKEKLVVLGMDKTSGRILRHGVQVRIESMSSYRASNGFFSSHSQTEMRGYMAFETCLVAGRRFELLDPAADDSDSWPPKVPLFPARVRWLEEERGKDPAAAVVRAQTLRPLVSEWTQLLVETQREQQPGQLKQLLNDLGPMPDEEESVDDVALWTAALLNPMTPTKFGVAREVRPAVLEANDALSRVEVVHQALVESVARMRERPPGPFTQR